MIGMTCDLGGAFGFAGQDDVARMLADGSLPEAGTLLCLRRHLPVWWENVALTRPGLSLVAAPVPPSLDPACCETLKALWTIAMPSLARPVLVFCKEGKHRTGMVAALAALAAGETLDLAISHYARRTEGEPRDREVAIIRTLAPFARP